MFTRRTLRACLSVSVLCLGACGDDEVESRPAYRADVSAETAQSTPVSSLEDGDLERVCRSYDAYVETYVSFEAISYVACLPAAIVLGGSEQGCEEQLQQCMDLFPEPITVQAQVRDTRVCTERLAQCDASIVELEGCANVNLNLVLDIIDNWSCRGLNSDRIEEAARAMNTVSVCADVDDDCAEAVRVGPD